MDIRPYRSVLYIPGSKDRALEKARELPVDAIIFDLEDAVAPDAKAEARATLAQALAEGGYGARGADRADQRAGHGMGRGRCRGAARRGGAMRSCCPR